MFHFPQCFLTDVFYKDGKTCFYDVNGLLTFCNMVSERNAKHIMGVLGYRVNFSWILAVGLMSMMMLWICEYDCSWDVTLVEHYVTWFWELWVKLIIEVF